jgi:hypothetical protein
MISGAAHLQFGNPLHDEKGAAATRMPEILVDVRFPDEDRNGRTLWLVETGHGAPTMPAFELAEKTRHAIGKQSIFRGWSPTATPKVSSVGRSWIRLSSVSMSAAVASSSFRLPIRSAAACAPGSICGVDVVGDLKKFSTCTRDSDLTAAGSRLLHRIRITFVGDRDL